MDKPKVFTMSFASIYDAYLNKAKRKNRTKTEVDEIIFWLTGYNADSLKGQLGEQVDVETFFNESPRFNPDSRLITGKVCGVVVEQVEDELMQRIRYLDKLIDELAKGRSMEKILRSESQRNDPAR